MLNRDTAHAAHEGIIFFALLLLALAPRSIALADFVTVDEAYHWFDRIALFVAAVARGDWAATNIVGHPGVTTLWLGSSGLVLHRLGVAVGIVPDATAAPAIYRAFLRFPIALVSSLCIAYSTVIVRRMSVLALHRSIALLAGIVWATDPFLVAYAQLLHVDALLTSFILLAVLLTLVGFSSPLRWRYIIAGGVMGGVAMLTKSPSVILIPFVALIAWVSCGVDGYKVPHITALARVLFARVVIPVGTWLTAAAITWVALWPFAWVNLPAAVMRVVGQATHDGGEPHGWGNFFLGSPVDDPGMLFYPVALVLRMSPLSLIGLLVLLVPAIVSIANAIRHRSIATSHHATQWLGWFALFALLYMLMMSLPPKKFDRYILPMVPMIDAIAAAGVVMLTTHIMSIPSMLIVQRMHVAVRWGAVVVWCGGYLLWYHPYELAHYNPLLGGGTTAIHAIPVGWGEGLEQAGKFISAQPDACDGPIASWFIPVIRTYYACPPWIESLDAVWHQEQTYTLHPVNYAVLYIDQLQRNNVPTTTVLLQHHYTPLHTVFIHNIPYATIYQLPKQPAHRIDADFGANIRLRGYDIVSDTHAIRTSGMLSITVQWEPLAPLTEDYMLFIHLFDAAGTRIAQIDVPPGGTRAPTSRWLVHGYVSWIHTIPVPTPLPAGEYWLTMGLYHPNTFERLPVQCVSHTATITSPPNDGSNVLVFPLVIDSVTSKENEE